MMELRRDMEIQVLQGHPQIFNPLSFSCWQDEDFVGRCCRIARKCGGNAMSMPTRVLQVALMKFKRMWGTR